MTLNTLLFIFVNETDVKLILSGYTLVTNVPANTIILYKKDYLLNMLSKGFDKKCRDPGSNRGPLDLQSNALPTELSRHVWNDTLFYIVDNGKFRAIRKLKRIFI